MTGVGRTCADTIKRSRHNVAIATQVLSPSAIGGSLRGQRRLKHFGPPDDDEEEFISYRRRAAWKKLGSYGVAIFAVILLLLGTVLAVGYLQVNKTTPSSIVVTRSVKLAQEGKPSSYIYDGTSTPETLSVEPTDSEELSPTAESSFLRSFSNDAVHKDIIGNSEENVYSSKEDDSEKGDYLVSYQANPNKENDPPFYNDGGIGDEELSKTDRGFQNNRFDIENASLASSARENEVEIGLVRENNNQDFEKGDTALISDTLSDEVPNKEKVFLYQNEGSTFSLEIPIYSPNKSQENTNLEGKDMSEVVLTAKLATFPENVVKPDEDRSGEGLDVVYTPTDKSFSDLPPPIDEHFHKTILQTALFRLDEEKENSAKPGATAIIIEDQGSDESSERLINSSLSNRNHKLTILQNDKVMNMKSTYTPDRSKPLPSKVLETVLLQEKVDENADDDINPSPPARKKNRMETGDRNKAEWKLKLRVNKDDSKVSLLGTIIPTPYPTGELTSSTENVYKTEESSRGFSSKLPNFEEFLKAFLSNVQISKNSATSESIKEFQVPPRTPPHSPHASDYGLKLATNLDAILPLTTAPPAPPTAGSHLDSSQFRKRTFITDNDHLNPIQAASLQQSHTYFDHLLGQNPTVGGIGTISAAGATYGTTFPTFPSYQTQLFPTVPSYSTGSSQLFDNIQPSSTSDISRLLPGIVPLDLASSYIRVGQHNNSPQQQSSGPFGYPNLYDNFGSFSSPSFSQSGTQNFQTGFGNVGSVTTGGGQPPTYNSIAQGMQLLNLISGTFPNTYFHDQVYQPSTLSTPTFQNDGLSFAPFPVVTPPTNQYPSTSESPKYNNVADILNSIPQHSEQTQFPPLFPPSSFDFNSQPFSGPEHVQTEAQPSLSLPLVSRVQELQSDREKVEKFLEEDEELESDQVPAASSFSQNILTTFKRTKNSPQKLTKPKRKPVKTIPTPKSFTFEIIPTRNISSTPKPISKSPPAYDSAEDPLRLSNSGVLSTSMEDSTSPSKKKSAARLAHKKQLNAKSLTSQQQTYQLANTGLKSGFFT